MDFIPIVQTVLAGIIIAALSFLIKHALSTKTDITNTKEELKKDMQGGFRNLDDKVGALDRKVGRLDQWMQDHEKIDIEQQKRADERYDRMTKTLDRLTVQ